MAMKKALGYVRVSTEDQSKEGLSLDTQREKIVAYCALNDLELVEISADEGISAKDIKGRPGFRHALDMVLSGQADCLVVWKLDRAFRRTVDALNTVETLNNAGRAFMSITEKLDTSTAVGEFFFSLVASLAQMERKQVGERTVAVLQGKKLRGEPMGRAPYGWTYQDGRLVQVPEEQEVISRMVSLKVKGYSTRQIVDTLKADGITTRKGTTFAQTQVVRILKAA
jgi:site-specific DNA recombinase